MIKRQISIFLFRWLVASAGMWLCLNWFASIDRAVYSSWLFIAAGLLFSLLNATVKPIATIISLPLIILTLGFFSILVNTAMVGLTFWLLPGVTVTFGGALFSSIVMSLINGLVNFFIPTYNKK